MNESPFFCVIIPTYNRARSVGAAIRSVLRQTDGDFECFVVDDGSTDDTPEVLSRFKDPRLRVILNGKNRGQHACRNQAIRLSSAAWICFLDSDDLYLPDRLATLRSAIAQRPAASFWFSNAYLHRYGRIMGTVFNPSRGIPQGRVPGYYAVGDAYLPYVTTTVCLRRSLFEKVGFYREDLRILEDTELYGRMLSAGAEVASIPRPLTIRFLHENQITGDFRRIFSESMEALRQSAAPNDVQRSARQCLTRQVASYLLKAAQPASARTLLKEELGAAALGHWVYWAAFLPAGFLRIAKQLRRVYLEFRYHPAFAKAETRDTNRFVAALLSDQEENIQQKATVR